MCIYRCIPPTPIPLSTPTHLPTLGEGVALLPLLRRWLRPLLGLGPPLGGGGRGGARRRRRRDERPQRAEAGEGLVEEGVALSFLCMKDVYI